MTTQAAAAAPSCADTAAREVAAVVATIARLADGNCATKDDVKLTGGDAQTRSVRLGMRVAIGWGSTNRALTGNRAVQGSQPCQAFEDVQRHLKQACGAACRDPATSKRVADQIALSPVTALDSFQDKYQIGPLPHVAHMVETCDGCGGEGTVACTNYLCANGKVNCFTCGCTGKATCSNCAGRGDVSVSGRRLTCGRCNGSGRCGYCPMCRGTRQVACGVCHGTAEVGCKRCGKTGCFTRIYSSHLVGHVSRTLKFDADAPDGFKRSCQAVSPMTALAQSTGSLVRAEVGSAAGEASMVLHCQVRHVQADITCKLERIHVDALGPSLAIPLMPPFLDRLTTDLVDDIIVTSQADPTQALGLATKARLTHGLLADVGRGSRPAAAAVARRWLGAVSEGHVESVDGYLRKAYARAARSPVRRTWLLLSPLLVVGPVLSNAYQVPLWLLRHLMPSPEGAPFPIAVVAVTAPELAAVLPAVVLVWLAAGRAGRRRLRADVGNLARSSPKQGAWPWVGLALALTAGICAVALGLDAAPMGLPWAPAARFGGRSLGQAVSIVFDGVGALASTQAKLPGETRPASARLQDGRAHHP